MAKSAERKFIPAFRVPGENEWRPIKAGDESGNGQQSEVDRNRNDFNEMLLASLQMQHLVVIAGSGCSISAGGPSMANLWDDAVGTEPTKTAAAVAEKVKQDLSDKNIESFLSRVEAFLQFTDDPEVAEFLNASRKVILEKCSRFIDEERLDAHRTFVHRLSRRRVRDQRLKVFTTNYDLCFERAASALGGVVLDGFSFAPPRRYDPRFFGYDIVRRTRNSDDLGNYLEGVFLLYKLHGSVNWARCGDGTIREKDTPKPEEACLIYPASGKYQQSYTQPYLESIAQYLAAAREPNTCVVVVGFGFNDDHLAEPLLAAAQSNPHLRMVIVDPGAEKSVATGNNFWRQFTRLAEQGEDVWIVTAGFEDFAQMIPDLKSLTPASTLVNAIKNVAQDR